jgi:hypothetical protein
LTRRQAFECQDAGIRLGPPRPAGFYPGRSCLWPFQQAIVRLQHETTAWHRSLGNRVCSFCHPLSLKFVMQQSDHLSILIELATHARKLARLDIPGRRKLDQHLWRQLTCTLRKETISKLRAFGRKTCRGGSRPPKADGGRSPRCEAPPGARAPGGNPGFPQTPFLRFTAFVPQTRTRRGDRPRTKRKAARCLGTRPLSHVLTCLRANAARVTPQCCPILRGAITITKPSGVSPHKT